MISSTQATGKRCWSSRTAGAQEIIKPGQISREMINWLRRTGVELRGGSTNESLHVYRRLPDVLTPLGAVMAGDDDFDPYKDRMSFEFAVLNS